MPLWQRFPDWRFDPCQQIASGFDGAVSVAVMAYALLLFIPLSLTLRYIFDAPAGWVFLTGAAAIAVLADWLRRATDQLAERAGSTIGGLLNISFGNTAELILALFVLSRVNTRIVQAQITGSIIGTTLLFFGVSALVGGLGRVRQTFSQASAGLLSTLLFLVVVAIMLPAVFDLTERVATPGVNASLVDERLSLGVSVLLLVLYAANLLYTLVTHRDVFAPFPDLPALGRVRIGSTPSGPPPNFEATSTWTEKPNDGSLSASVALAPFVITFCKSAIERHRYL